MTIKNSQVSTTLLIKQKQRLKNKLNEIDYLNSRISVIFSVNKTDD